MIRALYDKLIRYALKFGVIGIVGFVIDVGMFNLLRIGVFGTGHFLQDPIGAKIASTTLGIVVTWFGNRYWTFREHRRKNYLLELVEFTAVCIGGLLIGLLCLYISHYVLGLQSLLADNISSNGIGLVLATTFRFVMYRYWVYGHHRADGLTARQNRAEAAALALFEDDETASRSAARP